MKRVSAMKESRPAICSLMAGRFHDEVCINPFGNTHLAAGCVHVSDGVPGHRLPKADLTSVSAIDGALVVAQGPIDVVHCLLASFCLGMCGCGGRAGGHASHDQDRSRSGDIAT